ncbi:ferric reductase-like transmembrane domain-containing protein [Nocardioides rubriscoriae]|uniref:ferric reductase-like transmembrane domain-containing protein n=1 Tax=Nocardioides rubriscoriae TaxID=642762 RepID=UPI0011DF131D|nr:ferric reductase-like transmembrane domain-containing protein [Nocardioides rubriscoriae]
MILWDLARAAGYVAVLTATVTVVLGALGTAPSREAGSWRVSAQRLDRRLLRQMVHRSAGVLTLAMLALHAVLLVADAYVPVGVTGALVPFTAGFRGFALGLGTLATYGFVVAAGSGALRRRLATSATAVRTWRAVHLTSYLAWVLAVGHGVLAGTDTGRWWSWLLYGGCLAAVLGAVAFRLSVLGSPHASPLGEARQRADVRPSVTGGRR